MKLTTKGRYAVTAMLDLALHYQQGAVTLSEIAKRQASHCRILSTFRAPAPERPRRQRAWPGRWLHTRSGT